MLTFALLWSCAAVALHVRRDDAEDSPIDDQQLGVRHLVDDRTCELGWHAVNPSFARTEHADLAVAFKGMCLTITDDQRVQWRGSLVIGSTTFAAIRNDTRHFFAWDSLQLAEDPRFGKLPTGKEKECYAEGFDLMTGVDDVKLVSTKGGMFAIVNGYHILHAEDEERPRCGAKGVMSYAAKVTSLDPPAFGEPVELTFPGMSFVEKAWPMFITPDLDESHVRAVYSVYPHRIAKLDLETGSVTFEHFGFSAAVQALARRWRTRPGRFHAGGDIAHVKSTGEYYMGIMHTKVKKGSKTIFYSFPYKFTPHEPYQIFHVGNRLRLNGIESRGHDHVVARVTSLMFDKGYMFIAYSIGDRGTRTIRMLIEEFERRHFGEGSFLEHAIRHDDFSFEQTDFTDIVNDLEPFQETTACSNMHFVESCADPFSSSICRECTE